MVKLSPTSDAVELQVSDQGVGFDPGQRRRAADLGLLSMEERVKLLPWQSQFSARPGAGTELESANSIEDGRWASLGSRWPTITRSSPKGYDACWKTSSNLSA